MTKSNVQEATSSSEKIINQAVEKLTMIFTGWRATFKNKVNDPDFIAYKKEFLTSMILSGVDSQEMIDRGMMRARHESAGGHAFLPSGALFSAWCKPGAKELGIDDFDVAMEKILARAWSELHVAFEVVAYSTEKVDVVVRKDPGKAGITKKQRMSRYDLGKLKSSKDRETKAFVKKLYDEVVKRVLSGEPFEKPVPRIEDLSYTPNPHWKHSSKGQSVMDGLLGRVSAHA